MFQLCLVALTQECECLHSCLPHVVHISEKVSTSAFDESVNQALQATLQLLVPSTKGTNDTNFNNLSLFFSFTLCSRSTTPTKWSLFLGEAAYNLSQNLILISLNVISMKYASVQLLKQDFFFSFSEITVNLPKHFSKLPSPLTFHIYPKCLRNSPNSFWTYVKVPILEKFYPGYGWAMMTLKIIWYSWTLLSMLWVCYECYDILMTLSI